MLKRSPNQSPPEAKPSQSKRYSTNLVTELPPARERTPKKDSNSLQEWNDLIPDELLAAMESTTCPQERLAPLRLTKSQKDKVAMIHRPDAVWHHPDRRKKFQHLLNHSTSLTGSERDISFLCDAIKPQKDPLPLIPVAERRSAQRHSSKETVTMETLIPEEYHIIKSKGLEGLQCYDDKFTVLLEDDKKKLRVFPSLKPSGRLEVVQLMKVMDKMLEKAGVSQEFQELTGLSEIENLIELVQTEQNIYHTVFHEIIRQVSVECAERGQLLAKLRQKYVALLDRVPRQMKSLHTQILAQRALDRRIIEEIIHFRNSIAQLYVELTAVKEDYENVSKEGEEAKEELARSSEDSSHDAKIVAEYRDLCELQLKRLERQISQLDEDRHVWQKYTYSLAVEVTPPQEIEEASRQDTNGQVISLIGHDGNITTKTLVENTVQLKGTEEFVVSPHTEKAKEAFSALETVRTLQEEIIAAEKRAISAEVRAHKAEEDLLEALDKIQDLEKQLQTQHSVETKSKCDT